MATRFIDQLMAEMINYGGMAATREEVYADALKVCRTRTDNPRQAARAADMFAFGPRTVVLTPEQVAAMPRFAPRTGEPVGFRRNRPLHETPRGLDTKPARPIGRAVPAIRKEHPKIPGKERRQP